MVESKVAELKEKLRLNERHLTILENCEYGMWNREKDTRKSVEEEISKLRQELDKCLRKNT